MPSKITRRAGALIALSLASTLVAAGPEQERNKENTLGFYNGWGSGAQPLFEKYVAPEMKQHSGAMKDGRQAYSDFIGTMDAMTRRSGGGGGTTARYLVAENDLVAVLTGAAGDMLRFNKEGKITEHWGFWQPTSNPISGPTGAAGHEARNRGNATALYASLKKPADAKPQVDKYVAPGFRQLVAGIPGGRDGFATWLSESLRKGAKWDVKHVVAEKDMVVLIGANPQPVEKTATLDPLLSAGGPMRAMLGNDPKTLAAVGSMGSPGCGDGPGFKSPERGKDGRAFVIALRFDAQGKISEYWQMEQPFMAEWACAGRWHANSLF
jgi:predicted SnoaL-like aldol condensation-catalyzing enzyme